MYTVNNSEQLRELSSNDLNFLDEGDDSNQDHQDHNSSQEHQHQQHHHQHLLHRGVQHELDSLCGPASIDGNNLATGSDKLNQGNHLHHSSKGGLDALLVANSTVSDLDNILDKFEADTQLLLSNPSQLLNCKYNYNYKHISTHQESRHFSSNISFPLRYVN